MNAFGMGAKEVLFSYTLEQLNDLVSARIERDKEVDRRSKKKRRKEDKPVAQPGTMKDLKLMFGTPRVEDG